MSEQNRKAWFGDYIPLRLYKGVISFGRGMKILSSEEA